MKCSFSKSNLSKEFISQYLLDKYHNYLTSSKRLPKDVIYIERDEPSGYGYSINVEIFKKGKPRF